MGYKPKVVQSGGYISGAARVQLSKDGKKIRITLHEDEKVFVIERTKETPAYVQAGDYFVSLSKAGDKLYSMRPLEGMFVAKVKGFKAEEGKPPAPKTFTFAGKDGAKGWDYDAFTVFLEIIKGSDKGMVIPYNLRYHFDRVEEDGAVVTGYSHPKSKYTPQLSEFLDVAGAWERGAIKYSDNVLPVIEKRVLREARTFNVLVKDGYVDKVFPTMKEIEQETIDDDEDLVDETAPDEDEVE